MTKTFGKKFRLCQRVDACIKEKINLCNVCHSISDFIGLSISYAQVTHSRITSLIPLGSNPTDDPGNDNFSSPIRMHNASTTTYVYGYNKEIYRLIRVATDDAGWYPWLILVQIRECVTWALGSTGILA